MISVVLNLIQKPQKVRIVTLFFLEFMEASGSPNIKREGGGCASETNRRMTTRRLIWALCDHPKSMMDDDGDERSDCIRNWRNSGRTSSASSPTCRPRTAKCSPSCSSGKRPETPPKSKWATAITKSKYSKFDLLLHEFFLFFVIL